MITYLNTQKPTVLTYDVQINNAPNQPQHRLLISEGAYCICIDGAVDGKTVTFNVPPLAEMLTPGDKRFTWETTAGNTIITSMEGTLTVGSVDDMEAEKSSSCGVEQTIQLTYASEGSLPLRTRFGNDEYHLIEQYGNYAMYSNGVQRNWIVCDPTSRTLQVVGDLLSEADQAGNEQFNKIKTDILNRTIGPVVEVTISGLADNQSIESKVDTGASCCSLDAQDVKIVPDSYEQDHELVFFTFRGVKYRAMVDHYQVVKTADGTSNRPAVIFNVTCNGTLVENVAFNLDDRSAMDYDVLLGMNFLDNTNFLIDPSKALHENITIELLDSALQSIT